MMMVVIYPEETGRGSPANSAGMQHERSLGVLWLRPSQIVGLLFILSVGCAWGEGGGSSGSVRPPQGCCLGWHSRMWRDGKGSRPPTLHFPTSNFSALCFYFNILIFFISTLNPAASPSSLKQRASHGRKRSMS